MLELLARYARDHSLTVEPGFAPKAIRWAITCDSEGRFLGVTELGDPSLKRNPGRTFPCCPELSQPEIKRGGSGCRHFLADNASVVALYGAEPDAKLEAKHAYFVDLLRQASATMPELAAAATCLEDSQALAAIQEELSAQGARPTDNVTFALRGADPLYPVESDAWHDWWRQFRASLAPPPKKRKGRQAKQPMRCLVSGELVEPVLTQPKIKGLADVGGIASGDVVAGYKQDSFRSYGLVQAENAAISEEKAAEYRAGLNRLLKESSKRLAHVKVVHWYRRPVPREDDPVAWLEDPPDTAEADAQDRARRLLRAFDSGEKPDLAGNHYYALTLSGAGGRVMVRDWMEGPFEELVRRVDNWFSHLAIIRRDGEGLARRPKFLAVLGALARELKDVPAPAEVALWRAALTGRPIPRQHVAQALLRTRVDIIQDQTFNHARMGLLKAFFVRQGDTEMQPGLNETHPSPAYQCGRLMAVLAGLQRRALGDVGAGLVQRYYAAASATPALVLGRLVRTSQYHLHKLETPLAHWWDGRIASVVERIGEEFPQTLDLAGQSLFALGYYHQIAADRARRAENAATETSNTATEETDHAR